MTKDENNQTDEVNLFDLCSTFWAARTTMLKFAMGSLAVGFLIVFVREDTYETRIKYHVQNPPPSSSEESVNQPFLDMFFSDAIFSQWKTASPNTKLEINDLTPTVALEGVEFAIPGNSKALISVDYNEIKIRSNNIELIDETLDYFAFVNKKLTNQFSDEVKTKSSFFKRLYGEGFGAQATDLVDATNYLFAIEKFTSRSKNGLLTLRASLPSKPEKIGVSKRIIISISLLLGVIGGIFFVLVRKAYQEHTEKS